MHILKVGDLFCSGVTEGLEGVYFLCLDGQWQLAMFLANPSAQELEAATRAPFVFALLPYKSVIFLLYTLEEVNVWNAIPTTIHLVPPFARKLPPRPRRPEERATLQVFLVDAATGILRVIRIVTFSHEMSDALYEATEKQGASAWDETAYDRDIEEAYRRWNPEQMAERAMVSCRGGD